MKRPLLFILMLVLLAGFPTAAQDPVELVGVEGFPNSCIPDNNLAGFTVRFNAPGEVTVRKQAYTDFLNEEEVIRSTDGNRDVVSFTVNAKELPERTVVQITISNGEGDSVSVAVNCTTGEVYNRILLGPDGRLNAGNDLPVVIYPRLTSRGAAFVEFYTSLDGQRGELSLTIPAAALNALPDRPEENIEIGTTEDGFATFYKLTSGEYQVNYVATAEGKVPVVIFDALSPTYIVRRDDTGGAPPVGSPAEATDEPDASEDDTAAADDDNTVTETPEPDEQDRDDETNPDIITDPGA